MIRTDENEVNKEWYQFTADKTFKTASFAEESFQIWRRSLYRAPFLNVKMQMLSWGHDPQITVRITNPSPDVETLRLCSLSPVLSSQYERSGSLIYTTVTLKPPHWNTEHRLNAMYNMITVYWYQNASSDARGEYLRFLESNRMQEGLLYLNEINYCEGVTLESLMLEL